MDKKVHSMWIYSILIVCVAILLIVISVLSESTVTPSVSLAGQEEKNFNSSIEEGISTLIEKNEQLEKDAAIKDKEIEILKNMTNGYKTLLEAKASFDMGEINSAKEKVSGISIEDLSDEAKAIYNEINEAEAEEQQEEETEEERN